MRKLVDGFEDIVLERMFERLLETIEDFLLDGLVEGCVCELFG